MAQMLMNISSSNRESTIYDRPCLKDYLQILRKKLTDK